MMPSIYSHLVKIFTFLAIIAAPFTAQAGDPPPQDLFNANVFKVSNKAVRIQLDEAGEDSTQPCDDMRIAVTNEVFLCMREKAKCEPTTAKDGTPLVSCAGSTLECEAKANQVAQAFWKESLACKETNADVTKPGCGNTITEFGEDCDLGETNGVANSTCNDQCKMAVVANGDAGAAPVGAQPQAGNNAGGEAAAGGCALNTFAKRDFPLWHLLALGMATGFIVLKTRRHELGRKRS